MRYTKFIKTDSAILHEDDISSIDLSEFESNYKVTITQKTLLDGRTMQFVATNLNAIELVMQLRPSALEGRRLKWARHVWSVHNLVAHPLMQILAFFKFYKAAFWLHDITVPKPVSPQSKTL